METIAPEHGFWNSQTPVSVVPGDDLVSVRFLERLRLRVSLFVTWDRGRNLMAPTYGRGSFSNKSKVPESRFDKRS